MIVTRDSRIDMRINKDLKEDLRQVAYKNGYTISKYLNKLIQNEVSTHQKSLGLKL
tara:strand:+ start:65 stop:232 length:168 start_codon:yes stop_codon:yes gene_type:complete